MGFWNDLGSILIDKLQSANTRAQIATNDEAAESAKVVIEESLPKLEEMRPLPSSTKAAVMESIIPGLDFAEIEDDLNRELERDEGFRSAVYQDSLGYWTIGIGRLVDKRKGGGITKEEAYFLLRNDIANAVKDLLDEPWFVAIMHDKVRVRALINMMFQMGDGTLNQFEKGSFELLRQHRFAECGKQLRKSLWYKQTPQRAERVIRMIETGNA